MSGRSLIVFPHTIPDALSARVKGVFAWPVRVYYEDTDAGGVVFYANYLKFFERARTEWLRAAGVEQQELAKQHSVIFIVRHTEVDYQAPARLDDQLTITVVIEKLGRASIHFTQEAWHVRDGQPALLATSRIKVGCVDAASLRPIAIPDEVLAKVWAN
jgi:acyl-CoA thioester hydrolase